MVYFLGLSLLLGMFGMAWGEMFQSATLAIVVTVVLFALSLSLFGVFHLPVVDLKISSGGREAHPARGLSDRRADDPAGHAVQRAVFWGASWPGPCCSPCPWS